MIALSGTFGQILSYVVSVDLIFFALTGAAVFVFRSRSGAGEASVAPGHPFTTIVFVTACVLVIAATVWNTPIKALIGYAILLAGVPAFLYWQRKNAPRLMPPRAMQSDYMHWAKFKPPVRYSLTRERSAACASGPARCRHRRSRSRWREPSPLSTAAGADR